VVWVHRLSAENEQPADVLGAKAYGLNVLCRLGLPVPPGFVISTLACRAFLADGRCRAAWPRSSRPALLELDAETVSVRSGAAVSMPGMMDTILNLDPRAGLEAAVTAVFRSWDTPRAPHLPGAERHPGRASAPRSPCRRWSSATVSPTAGPVVAFSRDPNTGAPVPYGDVLFGRQGDDVVSGRCLTLPLRDLADRSPAVWTDLLDALGRVEAHYRDACYLEFTFEQGSLWILQVRPGRFVGRAAVRVAVDLATEGVISTVDAVRRIPPTQLRLVRVPRLAPDLPVFARGLGAGPGGGDRADRHQCRCRGPDGGRRSGHPGTAGDITPGHARTGGRGGGGRPPAAAPPSHAAVVARSMGKPAVVGVAD
jgi:pyruvate,orthophosphate dikinase